MTDVLRFIKAMNEDTVPVKEQVVGLLWLLTSTNESAPGSVADLCKTLEAAGHASQNSSRMREQLEADKRVVRRREGFAISARHESQISKKFQAFTTRRTIRASDSVLPREIFEGTRAYIERVVAQINGSYDHSMHD